MLARGKSWVALTGPRGTRSSLSTGPPAAWSRASRSGRGAAPTRRPRGSSSTRFNSTERPAHDGTFSIPAPLGDVRERRQYHPSIPRRTPADVRLPVRVPARDPPRERPPHRSLPGEGSMAGVRSRGLARGGLSRHHRRGVQGASANAFGQQVPERGLRFLGRGEKDYLSLARGPERALPRPEYLGILFRHT